MPIPPLDGRSLLHFHKHDKPFHLGLLLYIGVYRNKKGEITKSKEPSIADVNRILARLSGAFTYAFQKEWITRSPFSKGDTLIVMNQESPRERILSIDEQRKLLQACQNADRRHIYPVILTALDSGCRRGELLKFRWRVVSLEKGELHVTATNAKTNRARTIDPESITIAELIRLWDISLQDSDGLIFDSKTNFTRAWRSALKAAEIITPTRFHDLRATAITFWLIRGMGMEFGMRLPIF
jgi:integrase